MTDRSKEAAACRPIDDSLFSKKEVYGLQCLIKFILNGGVETQQNGIGQFLVCGDLR